MATRLFKDIDLSFVPHPSTGDLVAKYDDEAIKNAVKNLVLTKHHERAFRSEIGSSVNNLLFELPSPGLEVMLRQEIQDVINNFEPRVDILDIQVLFSPDQHNVQISIIFKIRNTDRPIVVTFALNRTR
jgi:phage baseplate assembly protein W